MEFKQAKRKKFAPHQDCSSLPGSTGKFYKGCYNGYNVVVSDKDAVTDLFDMGCFGKGSLSKSAPVFNKNKDDLPDFIFEQQWQNRLKWQNQQLEQKPSTSHSSSDKSVASVREFVKSSMSEYTTSGSGTWKTWKTTMGCAQVRKHEANESEQSRHKTVRRTQNCSWNCEYSGCDKYKTEDNIVNLVNNILQSGSAREPVVTVQHDSTVVVVSNIESADNWQQVIPTIHPNLEPHIVEELHLTLQEAFYLNSIVGCLTIVNLAGQEMKPETFWRDCFLAEDNFLDKCVVYNYYRSRGWVVKSGLKYGGDLLLYNKGPAFCHATYVVRIMNGATRYQWNHYLGLNRLMETVKKDLIICQVVPPMETVSNTEMWDPQIIFKYSVKEMISRRWIPSLQKCKK